jgi:hypothetical protein
MKWGDVLRVKSEFPVNLWPNAVQAYHRWVRTSLRDNLPYDRFARALLTSSGSNFRVGPANFYRAAEGHEPKAIATSVALVFMGSRLGAWPLERQAQMAAFFSQIGYKATAEWKEEIVFFDPDKGTKGSVLPDGTITRLAATDDPREAFTSWLVSPKNPWFARAAVNRVWFWLVGRGIVHEADDVRPDNPPSNPELLAYLERVRGRGSDLKALYRLILNSAYQLSSILAAPGRPRPRRTSRTRSSGRSTPRSRWTRLPDHRQPRASSRAHPGAVPSSRPDQQVDRAGRREHQSAFLETPGRAPGHGPAIGAEQHPQQSQRLCLLNSATSAKLQQSQSRWR